MLSAMRKVWSASWLISLYRRGKSTLMSSSWCCEAHSVTCLSSQRFINRSSVVIHKKADTMTLYCWTPWNATRCWRQTQLNWEWSYFKFLALIKNNLYDRKNEVYIDLFSYNAFDISLQHCEWSIQVCNFYISLVFMLLKKRQYKLHAGFISLSNFWLITPFDSVVAYNFCNRERESFEIFHQSFIRTTWKILFLNNILLNNYLSSRIALVMVIMYIESSKDILEAACFIVSISYFLS